MALKLLHLVSNLVLLGQHFPSTFVKSIIVNLEEFLNLGLVLDESIIDMHSLCKIGVLELCEGILNLASHLCNGLILMIFVSVDTDSANKLVADKVVELNRRVSMLFTYLNGFVRFQAKAAVELCEVCLQLFLISG